MIIFIFKEKCSATSTISEAETEILDDGVEGEEYGYSSDTSEDDDYEEDVDNKNNILIPTELPKFSFKIENCLKFGHVWETKSTRCQFIDELAAFYSSCNDFQLNNSRQYAAIGTLLLEKYGSLRKEIDKICEMKNRTKLLTCDMKKKKLTQPWVVRIFSFC